MSESERTGLPTLHKSFLSLWNYPNKRQEGKGASAVIFFDD
jgi:hypothetical protein